MPPLNVLIDAHTVGGQKSGNETYIVNLLRGFAALNEDDRFVVAATRPEAVSERVRFDERFKLVPVSESAAKRILFDLPRIATGEKTNLIHVTYFAPPLARQPVVVSVHDVSYKRHPEWFGPRDRLVLTMGVGFSARRAAAVITLSECSRTDIGARLNVPLERVFVTPAAGDERYRRLAAGPDVSVLARHGIVGPYILAVGNLQPRKNLIRLVHAFARMRAGGMVPHRLVMAGKAQWRESELHACVQVERLSDVVIFPGYVPDADLVHLYNGADVFVYPSLFEGFGLPVLEAMACGVPVITSLAASLPEVAGDAAVLVDPENVDALADALRRVLGDRKLHASLVSRGEDRARQFTWERTARATRAVYLATLVGGKES